MSSVRDTLIQTQYLDELTSFILESDDAQSEDDLFELTGFSWSASWGGTVGSMSDTVKTILELARQVGDRPVAYSKATYARQSRGLSANDVPADDRLVHVHLYFLLSLDEVTSEIEDIVEVIIAHKGVNACLTHHKDAIRKLATEMHMRTKNASPED